MKKTARALFKEATQLKRSKKINQAIEKLEEAYKIGDYEYPSKVNEPDDTGGYDNYITTEDLVRKSKYLQEAGRFEEALDYINQLIKNTSSRAKFSVWEIFDLSHLYGHRAIILKKEKKYKEEFQDRVKSYCLDGMATRLSTPAKPVGNPNDEMFKLNLRLYNNDIKRIRNILLNLTDHKKLMDFINSISKNLDFKFDKNQVTGFMLKIIMTDVDPKKSLSDLEKLIK